MLPAHVKAPDDATPERYRAGENTKSNNDAWPDVAWWQQFNSQPLNRLMAQARAHNYDLAAAAARVAQADAQLRIAGAPLLPSLDASGSASRSRRSGGSQADQSRAVLSASYELDFFGRNRSQKQSAQAQALAGQFDYYTVALGVEASVATTFFNVLALQERLQLAEDNLDTAQQVFDSLMAQAQAGTATALDVAQQQNQLVQQEAAIAPIKRNLSHQINALAVLLGQAPSDFYWPQDSQLLRINIPKVVAGLPSDLLKRRPDIAQARAQLMAAGFDVSAAKAARFPSFSLTADAGREKDSLSGLFSSGINFYSLAGSITQPLFAGGRLKGEHAASRARYTEQLAHYQDTLIRAFEEVDNALTDVQVAIELEQKQQAAANTAKQALDIARAQLQQGIINIADMLNVQKAWFDARDQLVQARLEHLVATTHLYQALGGGWHDENWQSQFKDAS